MKKLFLLILIMICLPVHAQEPASMPGTFEQQAATKLPPSQIFQRKVLKGWVKENTNEDGSNRTSFLADDEIQDVDEELSSNSEELKDFNNIVNEKPQFKIVAPMPEIQKSIPIPDDATNWTEEEARENLFKNAVYTKDFNAIPKNDPNYKANMQAMNSGVKLIDDRYLIMFSDNSYGVMILTNELYDKALHYNKRGKLERIVYFNYPKHIYNLETFIIASSNDSQYPFTESHYTIPDGTLIVTGITTKKMGYIFNIDKSLNCYWKGNKGYTPDGRIFMTKKTFKY